VLRPALAATVALLLSAPAAGAETFCAGTGCELETAAEAFAAAADAPGPDVVRLVGIDEEGAFADAPGEPVEVIGAGATLRGSLTLTQEGSAVRGLELEGDLEAPVAEDADIDGDAELGCALSRHLAVSGDLSAACDEDPAGVSDSIVLGALTVPTRYSAYPPQEHDAGPGDVAAGDPAALRDAGDPAPLGPDERLEDVDGLPRMADGDGDGVARRDIGPREHHPRPAAAPAGNLLRNPGAEEGLAHWTAAGVSAIAYGDDVFPTAAAGSALGAGDRFFAGDQVLSGTLAQTVDLRPQAPEIDAGAVRFELSALLGGYRAEADAAAAEIRFAGPDGGALGAPVELPAVTAFDRGHAVTLLRRRVTASIPPLARDATVTLTAQRSGGAFADGYFDDLALTLAVPPPPPGQPPPPPPPPPGDPTLRPFAGVKVLTGSATTDRRGRIRLRLACADATVGRCAGVLTLVAKLRSDMLARRVGSAGFSVAAGRVQPVRLRVSAAARAKARARKRGRLRATLYAAARDGQGITATSTAPFVLLRRGR
jgi:hypothetical protein